MDPIPFAVTVSVAFLVLYSFGPGYLRALGLSLVESLAVVTGLFAATTVAAFHQFVRRARPEQRAEIPGPVRLKRLYYAVLIGIAVMVLLLLPLLL